MRHQMTYRFGLLLGTLAAAGILGVAGCSSKSSTPNSAQSDATGAASSSAPGVIPVPAPTTASTPAGPNAGTQAATTDSHGAMDIQAGTANPHETMDVGAAKSLTPQPRLDKEIAQNEKHGGSKKALAELYTERGSARMMDPQASPHLKYPAALSDFRKAVKLDPSNRTAEEAKDMIEAIYRGMGKPIPTD
ncbi:MAG: hypothetical protein ACLQVD_22315 [Capsulimonadaceae bacterium]